MFLINGWILMLIGGALYHLQGWPINYGYWVYVLIALGVSVLVEACRR